MKGNTEDKALRRRIREGTLRKQDVVRLMAELAFGTANDCVRLVLEEAPELEGMDLRLLSEIRRNEKGTVEIRFLDRLRILEQLSRMVDTGQTELDSFLQAMQGGEKQ